MVAEGKGAVCSHCHDRTAAPGSPWCGICKAIQAQRGIAEPVAETKAAEGGETYRPHGMRAPCRQCGSELGYLREVNGQDTVRCARCDLFQYNAPRTETGRRQRSVTTVHNGIRPQKRMEVLSRARARCEVCGSRGNLHVGHILSVETGLRFGLSDAEINDVENLLALCEECNLGQGPEPMPLGLAIAILRARIAWRDSKDPQK